METTIYSELSSRIAECSKQISGVVRHTPLHPVPRLSEKYEADIWFKREDKQVVRSYKIRGGYNTMVNLDAASRAKGDRKSVAPGTSVLVRVRRGDGRTKKK